MIEMSAATVPALAQPGAILAAAPAPASSEIAPAANFSTVLAGAALVAQMPDLAAAPEPEPQTSPPIVPDLAAKSPKPASKTGTSGKENGKMLPPGKLPMARDAAVTIKAQPAVLTDETEDEPASAHEVAPADQAPVDAPVGTMPHDQAAAASTISSAPTAPIMQVVQQTAAMLQERTPSHGTPQATPEPAPLQPASIAMRQTITSRSSQTAIPTMEQTTSAASPLPAPSNVAELRVDAAVNSRTAVRSGAVAASSLAIPEPAAHEMPVVPSNETNAASLPNARSVPLNAAPEPSNVVATHDTEAGSGPAAKASPIAQFVAAASTTSASVTAPASAAGPSVSTKAALVATTAANLAQPAVAQTAGPLVRTDARSAGLARTAAAAPALPLAAALAPALAPEIASADRTLPSASASAPAPLPTATASSSISPDLLEIDIAPPPATLATSPLSLMMPNAATSISQPAPPPVIAPVLQVTREIVGSPVPDDLTIAVPVSSLPTPDQGKAAAQVAPTTTAPGVQSTRDAAVAAALSPVQPLHQALTAPLPGAPTAHPTPLASALPAQAPDVATQQPATIAPAPSRPRTEPAIVAQPALATAEPAEHKRALPVAATEAASIVSRPEPISIVTGSDMRTAAIFSAPTTPATATTPTQDIAALVDRITEARAAAAPNTIRAALVHEDFGAVSLNFRSEASHIHVTLGSADPGFAPAVQAAAAANLANNGSDDAQNRRDAPAPQTNSQPQDATRNESSQQQQQAQRDRANAGERQASRQTPGRQPAHTGERASNATVPGRRSGIYA